MWFKKVIKTLDQHQIPYALVGGYAVALHGVLRHTVDLDFLTKLNKTNLQTLEKAMKELGLQSRIPVTADEIYQFRQEYIERRNLIAWSFVNPKNPLEVIDILINHDVEEFEVIKKKIEGLSVRIIDIDGLIALKKEANRPQDKEDLKHLQWIKKNEKK